VNLADPTNQSDQNLFPCYAVVSFIALLQRICAERKVRECAANARAKAAEEEAAALQLRVQQLEVSHSSTSSLLAVARHAEMGWVLAQLPAPAV
jgi:hypothetical protein